MRAAAGLGRLLRARFSKPKDYYQTLGLKKGATPADVKKAYVKLAREYHPDRNSAPNAKDKFTEISEAYQTLSDEKKRSVYDNYGIGADEQKQYEGGFDGAQDFSNFADFFGGGGKAGGQENIFKDFEDFFGGGGGEAQKGKRVTRGADIVLSFELEFMDVITGVAKEIAYKTVDVCGVCQGSKCKPGTAPTKCGSCNGKGSVNFRQGPMVIQMGCSACGGAGSAVKSPCTACRGNGSSYKTVKETVNIPRGVNNGQTLRLTGKGNLGDNGGPRGDLLIKIVIKADRHFRREDYNIISDLQISIAQAVLGVDAEVKTVSGTRKIRIPPGTAHGAKVRLIGEGVPKLAPNDGERGDHFVVVQIAVPTKLTAEQRELFEKLQTLEASPKQEKKGWFS